MERLEEFSDEELVEEMKARGLSLDEEEESELDEEDMLDEEEDMFEDDELEL